MTTPLGGASQPPTTSHQPGVADQPPAGADEAADETPAARRPSSPFEDAAVIARVSAILRRGYERRLAEKGADRAKRDTSPGRAAEA